MHALHTVGRVLIANYKSVHNSQLKEYAMNSTCNLAHPTHQALDQLNTH